MEIVGKATGETSLYRLLDIFPFYDPPTTSHNSMGAIEQALQKAGNADALLNASVDVERGTFLGVFSWELGSLSMALQCDIKIRKVS